MDVLEPNSFFICTEKTERCYVIQKVNAKDIGRVADELRLVALRQSCPAAPLLPMLPWWFTAECERQLNTGDSGYVPGDTDDGFADSDLDHVAMTPSPEFIVTTSDGQQQTYMPIDIQVDGFGSGTCGEMLIDAAAAAGGTTDETMMTSSYGSSSNIPSTTTFVSTNGCYSMVNSPRSAEELRMQLRAQLEYYFSRENLATDRYLRSQMDNDQYVPIRIIAGFPKVMRLTSDLALIVDVLRDSPNLQVDDAGEKVRAVCKRCTIILREIPESTDKKEVEAMFEGGPPYVTLDYGLNNSWYVTFETEEATQKAFMHLQTEVKTFHRRPICARIKTGNAPIGTGGGGGGGAPSPGTASSVSNEELGVRPTFLPIPMDQADSAMITDHAAYLYNGYSASPTLVNMVSSSTASTPAPTTVAPFDLGQILELHGFVPCSTYQPGATVVHVTPATMALSLEAARQQQQQQNSIYRNRASSCIGVPNDLSSRGPSPQQHYYPISGGGGGGGGRYRGGGRNRGGAGGSYYYHQYSGGGYYDRNGNGRNNNNYGGGRGHRSGYGGGRVSNNIGGGTESSASQRSRTPPNIANGYVENATASNGNSYSDREMRQRSASDYQSRYYDRNRQYNNNRRMQQPYLLGSTKESISQYPEKPIGGDRIRSSRQNVPASSSSRASPGSDSKQHNNDDDPSLSINRRKSSADDKSLSSYATQDAHHQPADQSHRHLQADYKFDPSSFPSLPTPAASDHSDDDGGQQVLADQQHHHGNSLTTDDNDTTKRVSTPSLTVAAAVRPIIQTSVAPVRTSTLSFSSVAAGTASAKHLDDHYRTKSSPSTINNESTTTVSCSSAAPANAPQQKATTTVEAPAPTPAVETVKRADETHDDQPKRLSYAEMAVMHQRRISKSIHDGSSSAESTSVSLSVNKDTVVSSAPRIQKRWPAPSC